MTQKALSVCGIYQPSAAAAPNTPVRFSISTTVPGHQRSVSDLQRLVPDHQRMISGDQGLVSDDQVLVFDDQGQGADDQ